METFLNIDYPTWWFLVIGAVFTGYAVLDGFDLGAGAWHLLLKKDEHRRIALNAVGPVWDGNEVWLVIGGGALFAGFPEMYASLFSAMYIPFMLFLLFIILRAVSIEFRSKEEMTWWKKTWDISYSVSSAMLGFLLGVVLGNVLIGMPLDENFDFTGSWLSFLNPYSIITGLTTLSLMMVHGAIFLALKTEGELHQQIEGLIKKAMLALVSLFVILTVFTIVSMPHLTDKLLSVPILFTIPVFAFLSILNVARLTNKQKHLNAFIFSSITFALLLILVATEMYPTFLISTSNPENTITVYNAASSEKSLGTMLVIAAIGTPLIIAYTIIVYKVFWGKVKLDEMSY